MSIKQTLCESKYFNSNLCQMRQDVLIKGLGSRILVYLFWPWYSTWAIQERQSCTQKIGSKLRLRNTTSHFSGNQSEPMAQWFRRVAVTASKYGYLSSILAGCWNSLQLLCHFAWHWGCPSVHWHLRFYIAALAIIFLFWISSVAISRWQGFNS